MKRPARKASRRILALAVIAVAGCTSQSALELDRLAILPPEQDTTEIPLGEFVIPIPEESAPGAARKRNYMEMEFALLAEVRPEDKLRLAEVFALREGTFRDCVIQVCRSATAEDLSEPELVTLKMRLLEAIEPILGLNLVRKLVFNSLKQHEL